MGLLSTFLNGQNVECVLWCKFLGYFSAANSIFADRRLKQFQRQNKKGFCICVFVILTVLEWRLQYKMIN